MKVLAVNTEKTWRGGERQTCLTVKGLTEAGVDTDILCLEGYPLKSKSELLKRPVIGASGQCDAAYFLKKSGKNYDIIHAHSAKAQTLAVLTKPFHERPVVYTRRVDFVPKGLPTKLKYRYTDRVVAVSNAIKTILKGFGIGRVEVIPDAVEERILDIERAQELRRELKIDTRKVIATTAALVPHKDPLMMVEAIRELSIMRSDFIFLHFGEGELRHEVEEKIRHYGIGEIYKLMGHHDDVEDYFDIFDLFVMSSKEEGFGSSVLDAFIYRVPVVSTDAGGLKESVGGRGLLCPVGDYRCLAGSMDRILKEHPARTEMVERAYGHAREFYSVKAMTDRYLKVFNSCLR